MIRISIVPLDLGIADRDACDIGLRLAGYTESTLTSLESRVLGPRVKRYSHQGHDDWNLFVDDGGFGVAQIRYEAPAALEDVNAVASHLIARRECHREHCGGNTELCREIERLRLSIASREEPSIRRGLWDGVPYVFSFFLVPQGPDATSEVAKQCLHAIAEPSSVGAGDTWDQDGVQAIATEIVSLAPPPEKAPWSDIDLSSRVTTYATWAGLVVLLDPDELVEAEQVYVSLEVRVQLAWSAAFFARRWCERSMQSQSTKTSDVEMLRWHVLSAVRQARRITDASMPTRFKRIMEGLAATSGLDREIEDAEVAFGELELGLAAMERREQRRYARVIEGLLGVLAVTQLVPLIHDGPLVKSSTILALVVFGVLTLSIAVLAWRRN